MGTVKDNGAKKNLYETTFCDSRKYDIKDILSFSFVMAVTKEISERAKVPFNNIKFEISAVDYSISVNSSKLRDALVDAATHNRELTGISIESGVVYREKETDKNFLSRDYHSIIFSLRRSSGYISASIRVQAVSYKQSSSQQVIDWGHGAIVDLTSLQILDQKPELGEPVIDLKTGSVKIWDNALKQKEIQKVEVVNQEKTTWKNFYKSPGTTFAILSFLAACIIAAVTWCCFS